MATPGGAQQRFCQQCTRLEPVAAFEGSRRSCRASLARRQHRLRRKRSSSPDSDGSGGSGGRGGGGGGSRRVLPRTLGAEAGGGSWASPVGGGTPLHHSLNISHGPAQPVQLRSAQPVPQPRQAGRGGVLAPSPFTTAAAPAALAGCATPAAAPKGARDLASLLASLPATRGSAGLAPLADSTPNGSGGLASLASLASASSGFASLASLASSTAGGALRLDLSPLRASAQPASTPALDAPSPAPAQPPPAAPASPLSQSPAGADGSRRLALPSDPRELRGMLRQLIELHSLIECVGAGGTGPGNGEGGAWVGGRWCACRASPASCTTLLQSHDCLPSASELPTRSPPCRAPGLPRRRVAVPQVRQRLADLEAALLLKSPPPPPQQQPQTKQATSAGASPGTASGAQVPALLPLAAGTEWEHQRMTRAELVCMLRVLGGQLSAVSLLPRRQERAPGLDSLPQSE